jgi:hypothetical protein
LICAWRNVSGFQNGIETGAKQYMSFPQSSKPVSS